MMVIVMNAVKKIIENSNIRDLQDAIYMLQGALKDKKYCEKMKK